MPRTEEQVVQVLCVLYKENFGGKENQRFLISWEDLRAIYGYQKLYYSRVDKLIEAALEDNLYIWDLGQGENGYYLAVIRTNTVDRWRRVPKKVIDKYKISFDESNDSEEVDFE